MKFLCLCYYDHAKFEALTPEQLREMEQICRPRDEALRDCGHLFLVGSLALPAESRTLRPGKDGVEVVAGPHQATREPLGAFFVVEAESMDQALEAAALHPGAHLGQLLGGAIEVRACDHFELAECAPAALLAQA